MCTVSNIGDTWSPPYPWKPASYPNLPPTVTVYPIPEVTQEDLDNLKKEIEALKKLLKAAKIYDEETGQPDCENAEKVALIKRFAELVDVDLSEIFDE